MKKQNDYAVTAIAGILALGTGLAATIPAIAVTA
jgi:hypothetical protein